MSTHRAPLASAHGQGAAAVRRDAPRSPTAESRTVERRHSSTEDELRRLQDRFDTLIRDYVQGARSHREHDRIVAEAEAIAAGMCAAFRGPARKTIAPSHPPLFVEGGRAMW